MVAATATLTLRDVLLTRVALRKITTKLNSSVVNIDTQFSFSQRELDSTGVVRDGRFEADFKSCNKLNLRTFMVAVK